LGEYSQALASIRTCLHTGDFKPSDFRTKK